MQQSESIFTTVPHNHAVVWVFLLTCEDFLKHSNYSVLVDACLQCTIVKTENQHKIKVLEDNIENGSDIMLTPMKDSNRVIDIISGLFSQIRNYVGHACLLLQHV